MGVSFVIWILISILRSKISNTSWDAWDILPIVLWVVSYVHLIMISLDRFIAIILPLRYTSLITKQVMSIMIALTWFLPISVTTAMYCTAFARTGTLEGQIRMDNMHYTATIVLYLIFSCILSILYGKIMIVARTQAKKIQAWSSANTENNTNSGKSTRMVSAIMFASLALNFLYVISCILRLLGSNNILILTIIEYIGQECSVANSSVNVLIYAAFSSDFRRAFKSMLCIHMCKRK